MESGSTGGTVVTLHRYLNTSETLVCMCGKMDEVLFTDFHPKTKVFSVREVRLITYYLGKPGV
ncbi:DUF6016 domain-containing protein [Bacteroides sp. AN502(2024)]|uniref:DUF6016 domain-containing protein n=1 Tax=Bacteroides sp. AN502(2024) TaxID=3160599 RepID=UPI0035133913